MKKNIRYIVVHSTKTLPEETCFAVQHHYIIHRNGDMEKSKRLADDDKCVQIAYLGGIDSERKICDTKTVSQSESLFNLLIALTEKYAEAKIVGADEIFGATNDPGFNVRDWLKNYTPQIIKEAA